MTGKSAAITRYDVRSARWTAAPIRIAVLSDLHVGAPWVSRDQLAHWVGQANALMADLIIQAGDLLLDRNMRPFSRQVPAAEIVAVLAGLRAPLGVWSVMGNHDWKDCDLTRMTAGARNSVIEACAAHQLPILENRAVSLRHEAQTVWLAGLGSRSARRVDEAGQTCGYDDLQLAMAEVPPDAPSILIAHEPDIFLEHDGPEALQISGHTHGGQANLFGWRPLVPSAYGARLAYGHHVDGDRQLIVSGGLGYSGLPLRIGVPPEILLIELSGGSA